MVVVQVNAVYKSVNQPLLAFLCGDVYLAEVIERKQYLFLCQHGVARLCLKKFYFKVSLAFLQLVQSHLCRGRINALRDCLHKIVQFGFNSRELCLYC